MLADDPQKESTEIPPNQASDCNMKTSAPCNMPIENRASCADDVTGPGTTCDKEIDRPGPTSPGIPAAESVTFSSFPDAPASFNIEQAIDCIGESCKNMNE